MLYRNKWLIIVMLVLVLMSGCAEEKPEPEIDPEAELPEDTEDDVTDEEAIKVLLENGIDVNLRDDSDYTALGVALRGDFKETAELIKAYGGVE